MKKTIRLFLIAAIVASAFVACKKSPETQLVNEIERAQKECPIKFGVMGELENILWVPADSQVVYSVKFNEKIGPIKAFGLQNDTALVVSALRNSANRDDQSRQFFRLMTAAGASLRIDFIGAQTGDTVRYILDKNLINEKIVNGGYMELSEWHELLKSSIRSQAEQLPQSMGDGMTMIGIDITDTDIVYTVRLDAASVQAVGDKGINPETVKKNMIRMLHASRSAAQFATLVKSAGLGLQYNFVGPDDQSVISVEIPSAEL